MSVPHVVIRMDRAQVIPASSPRNRLIIRDGRVVAVPIVTRKERERMKAIELAAELAALKVRERLGAR
jgi:hypothetical protein